MLFKRMEKKKLISNIIAITLLLAFSVLIEGGTTLPKIVNLIFIYSIAALSLNVICGCLGEFVLGHGGFLLIGYTVFVLMSTFLKDVIDPTFFRGSIYTVLGGKLHLFGYVIVVLLVLICGILTGLIGLLVGAIALGRLKGDYLAIVTLGISLIFVNIAKNFKAIGGAAGIGSSSFLGGTPLLRALFCRGLRVR